MKDVALIAVNMEDCESSCENTGTAVENTLKFLEQIDSVGSDTEEVIFGTFPVLLIGSYGTALQPYASEGMTFQGGGQAAEVAIPLLDAQNEGGQTVTEVLELLDIRNAYVCGSQAEVEIKQLCAGLKAAKIHPYLLEDALAFSHPEDSAAFLEEMKASGVKVTRK